MSCHGSVTLQNTAFWGTSGKTTQKSWRNVSFFKKRSSTNISLTTVLLRSTQCRSPSQKWSGRLGALKLLDTRGHRMMVVLTLSRALTKMISLAMKRRFRLLMMTSVRVFWTMLFGMAFRVIQNRRLNWRRKKNMLRRWVKRRFSPKR